MSTRWFILFSILFSILVLIPYVLAFAHNPGEAVFQGFLINPVDGNSYLAKMYQGWSGSWQFRLPYTAEPGDGAYLFLYYLFLGHLARWVGLPLILTYHLARWLGSLFMLWALLRFYASLGFKGNSLSFAFILSAFGAGLGWLVFLSGKFTADFWIAEAYPFLSAYTNPHFPLGLGLMLYLLSEFPVQTLPGKSAGKVSRFVLALAALLLAVLSPFGVVIVLLVLGVRLAWRVILKASKHRGLENPGFLRSGDFLDGEIQSDTQVTLLVLVFGLPVLLYDWLITQAHPILAQWNAQNLTPSPPTWDVLISFSPVILLAVVGLVSRIKSFSEKADTLAIWLVISLILMIFPWGLQRRFMTGLYVPAAGLAVIGILFLSQRFRLSQKLLFIVLLLLSIQTPLIVILAGQHGVQKQDPALFLSAGETECLSWIEENTSPDALVLASPDMGLFIPAVTGRRVLYGHPFETAWAEQERDTVLSLIQQSAEFELPENAWDYLRQRGVDYLLWGKRESQLGELPAWPGLTRVCSAGDTSLYQLQKE